MRGSFANRGGSWSSPALVWLALILATYAKTDPGWSFSGIGAPIANRGGVVGAWLADLLLYLFGVSAWWWVVAGVVLVIAGYRRIGHPDARPIIRCSLGCAGLRARAARERRARSVCVCATCRRRCRRRPAARSATSSAAARRASFGFNGATLLLLALFAVGSSLFFGMSWLKVMERIGAGIERLVAAVAARAASAVDREIGDEATAEREARRRSCSDEDVDREPVLVVPAGRRPCRSPSAS